VIVLGIDPGMNGGIAKLKQDGDRWIPSAIHMPATERDIADHFWQLYAESQSEGIEIIAFLEKVQPMPSVRRVKTAGGEERVEVNPGMSSSGKFMQGYGFLRGCLITIGIRVEDLRPQEWQKLMGCLTRGNKNISKGKAQQLFPQMRITHAIADSLVIAECGRRIRKGLAGGPLFAPPMPQATAAAPWEAQGSST